MLRRSSSTAEEKSSHKINVKYLDTSSSFYSVSHNDTFNPTPDDDSDSNASQSRHHKHLPKIERALMKINHAYFLAEDKKYKRCLFRGVTLFNPASNAMLCWEIFNTVVILAACILAPAEVAFDLSKQLFEANIFFSAVFGLDILVNFNLPFEDYHTGHLVMDRYMIAIRYLKFWFWVDFVSFLPIPEIALAILSSSSSSDQSLELIATLRSLKLFRLLRLLRVERYISMLYEDLQDRHDIILLLNFFCTVLFIVHIQACGLVFIANIEHTRNTWLKRYGIFDASFATKYTAALYWSVMTVTTVGYGDVAMATNTERIYAVFWMFVGAFLFAYLTGRMAGLLIRMNRFKDRYMQVLGELNMLAKDVALPHAQRETLMAFFRRVYVDVERYDSNRLLLSMSPTLRVLIAMRIHRNWVSRWPLMRSAPPEFIAELALSMDTEIYMPREVICSYNSIADRVWIVHSGVVGRFPFKMIKAGDEVDFKAVYNVHEVFGEEALLWSSCTRKYACFSGSEFVSLQVISRSEFQRLVNLTPSFERQVKKYNRINNWGRLVRILQEHRYGFFGCSPPQSETIIRRNTSKELMSLYMQQVHPQDIFATEDEVHGHTQIHAQTPVPIPVAAADIATLVEGMDRLYQRLEAIETMLRTNTGTVSSRSSSTRIYSQE